jgi:hypothetical protein
VRPFDPSERVAWASADEHKPVAVATAGDEESEERIFDVAAHRREVGLVG